MRPRSSCTNTSTSLDEFPASATLKEVVNLVIEEYHERGRVFPWRMTHDPWAILVSEVMLQQTQVNRVIGKFESWTRRFPDPASCARASLESVLVEWKGLGYNRRAVALRDASRIIVERHDGKVPADEADLLDLPGIGIYTARAIRAFAFNEPSVFIETNIRSVFIHFFFEAQGIVKDKEIMPVAQKALKRALQCGIDARTWYFALMDYGARLKQLMPNPGRRSASYAKQGKFQGSGRQARGAVLASLASSGPMGDEELSSATGMDAERMGKALRGLCKEGIVQRDGNMNSIVP